MKQCLISSLISHLALTILLFFAPSLIQAAQKSPENYFLDGLQCLQDKDSACATIAHSSIPAQSVYAKILEGAIAINAGDHERTLRVLLPVNISIDNIQPALIAPARYSLHSNLALAFKHQQDALSSLNQFLLAAQVLPDEDIAQTRHQLNLWDMLMTAGNEALISARGEASDTATQAWIDLALAANSRKVSEAAFGSWRKAYRDHALANGFSSQIIIKDTARSSPAPMIKVALLLPMQHADFYQAAEAIEQGFNAARIILGDALQTKLYATSGDATAINSVYQRAIQDGAQAVVGPLTREEVSALNIDTKTPTLLLNKSENAPDSSYNFGLAIDSEARQIMHYALKADMQSARVIAEDTIIAKRMETAFAELWKNDGRRLFDTLTFTENDITDSLQAKLNGAPSDMIILAGSHAFAKKITLSIDAATPVYAFSPVYSGINGDPEDAELIATQFVDMPWLLNPTDNDFESYRKASTEIPAGQMQRWFALGADAYRLIRIILTEKSRPYIFKGLTGKITLYENGRIGRELPLARFSRDGIKLEEQP